MRNKRERIETRTDQRNVAMITNQNNEELGWQGLRAGQPLSVSYGDFSSHLRLFFTQRHGRVKLINIKF